MTDGLDELERTGALKLLQVLLTADYHVSDLIRRTTDGSGVASQPALEKTRRVLGNLGLIEEYEKFVELTRKTRHYLRLTPKGRRIAQHVKAIAEILAET